MTTRTARVLADGFHFGEGPRWHDGRLYLSDFYAGSVKAVTMDGDVETVLEVPGQPSGLGWLPDGRMLVVSMLDRKVLRLDPDGLVEHADLSTIATFHCNDMVVDGQGRAYVGNFGFDLDGFVQEHGMRATLGEPGPPRATLARVDPDGTVHAAATGLRFPNGTVITPDGATLIVAETIGRRLTAFDVAVDGSLSNQRVWAQFERRLPDGICLDAEGRVWAADAATSECVLVAGRDGGPGEVVDVVRTEDRCFACMLGGSDGRQLFVLTAASEHPERAAGARTGRVLVATVDVPHAGWP
jgi:sugar lactone lactonase YvrE